MSTQDTIRVTFPRVVRSEWIKFRTLRSPGWTLSIGATLMIGFGVLMALSFSVAVAGGVGDEVGDELGVVLGPDTGLGLGVVASTFGIHLGQLAVATLGVLIVSGEYSTGMIRSTFVAVPKRLPVLWAKAIVFAVVAFVVGVLATLATFLATGPILAAGEMGSSLGNQEVQRILVGAGLYLAAVGVLSMGLGAIVRNAAGGIGAAVALLVVLPGLITLIPGEWVQQVTPFLPSNAGQRIIEEVSATATLGPWQGYGVLLLWVAATLAAAAVTLRKRDA